MMCFTQFLAGEWDGSWRSATDGLSIGHRIGSPRSVAAGLGGRALVLCHRGDLAAAAQCLAEARTTFGGGQPTDRHVFGFIDTVEVLTALHGDAAVIAGVSAGAPADGQGATHPIPELHLAAIAETQLATGAVDSARATADRVARLGPGAPYPAALAGRLTGLIHRARGDPAAAGDASAEAARAFAALGMPFDAARCRLEWAAAVGDRFPADAVQGLQAALRSFTALGARRYADRARHLIRRLGAQPAPAPRAAAADLSPREIEVVGLVAEGLSNTEIARRLVISPRTVTTHLQHVYARLGIGSRTALVRYAIERDLPARAIRRDGPADT
jgi:DNA-binding NarL/FixJ family response regulator